MHTYIHTPSRVNACVYPRCFVDVEQKRIVFLIYPLILITQPLLQYHARCVMGIDVYIKVFVHYIFRILVQLVTWEVADVAGIEVDVRIAMLPDYCNFFISLELEIENGETFLFHDIFIGLVHISQTRCIIHIKTGNGW